MLLKIAAVFALYCVFVSAQDAKDKISGFPTQPSISSSTSPSNATTHAPNTTSTTSATTTTSSTVRPTTAPTEPTTALPPPTIGKYVVKDGNTTCLMADLAVQVELTIGNMTKEFDVPANIYDNSSNCNNDTQELVLTWEDESGKNNTLSFQFAKNDTTKKFMVSQINLWVQQNGTLNLTNDKAEFATSMSKSYLCDKQQEVKLFEEETNATYAVLKMSHVHLQAFHTSEDEKFAAAEDCSSSSSPDIVPIAVGCALVGLIAIVLIAYLVGRRRSQARGYLSM